MKVEWKPQAEADLVEIGVYTCETWGEEQMDLYHHLLVEACERIIPRSLKFARSVPHRPGMFRWRCERHVIYFRKVPGGIAILRVLHEKMIPEAHL